MDKYQQANLNLWNERTDIHAASDAYDLAGFKAGKTQLHAIELEELGPEVGGRTMLHLQCHFGRDSMMWARLGTKVTGVDFSDKSIKLARKLNAELGLDCEFVQSDVLLLPDHLEGEFDIVFTSYGVLAWLPDIKRWGEVIAHFLKPGGIFYIVEDHPFAYVFDDAVGQVELKPRYPYFHQAEPMEFETEGSYADPDAHVNQPVKYEWFHPLGDIVSALTSQGLHIEYLHEFNCCSWQMMPVMEKRGEWWYLPEDMPQIPLTYSIKAIKR